jgi:hypothetical protein
MGQPIVWIIGDWKQAEFDEAVQWLKTQCFKGQARCTWFDDAAAALSSLRAVEGVPAPPAILLIQSRPGQIRQGDLERLHAAAPLARLCSDSSQRVELSARASIRLKRGKCSLFATDSDRDRAN